MSQQKTSHKSKSLEHRKKSNPNLLVRLDDGSAPSKVEVLTEAEANDYVNERLRIENVWFQTKVDHATDLHQLRKRYTSRLFWLTVGWLLAVILFVLLSGFQLRGFALSEKTIIAFITSTTVSVLGLFLISAKWLFPAAKRKNRTSS